MAKGLIMIIDDSRMDMLILKCFIEVTNFAKEIIVCSNPVNALNYFTKIELKNIPSIIFLDLNMPIMSGFEFLDLFMLLPKAITDKSKFIILTSSDDPMDIKKSGEYKSVIDYIVKPICKQDLLAIKLLKHKVA